MKHDQLCFPRSAAEPSILRGTSLSESELEAVISFGVFTRAQ